MLLPFLIVAAIVPAVLLVWFFRSRDLHPEPRRVIWTTFALGVVIIVPECLVAMPLAALGKGIADPVAHGLYGAVFTAALPEESFKFLVVVLYCMRHRAFDEPMDGVVYGAVTGLGFACLENVLYVAQGSFAEAVMRGLTAVPNHACLGAIMGYFVGRAKFAVTGRGALLARALLVPALFHALYDFPLIAIRGLLEAGDASARGLLPVLTLASFTVLVVEVAWTARLVRRARVEQEGALAQWRAYWTARGVVPAAGDYPRPTPMVKERAPRVRTGPLPPGRWVAAVSGFLLASAGGVAVLGSAVMATMPPRGQHPPSAGGLIAFALFAGAIPLACGLALFAFGLRPPRGRSAPAPSPSAR